MVQLHPNARILIIGQAPGVRVHKVGAPFVDASGDRLRAWMGVDETVFYDVEKVAVSPMGFCFPGLTTKGADKPPRKECAPQWQARVEAALTQVRLTILVGFYAQKSRLGAGAKANLTETVAHWRDYGPQTAVLPHPSWRNTAWLKKHPWFERECLPDLKSRVAQALA
ncbi:MAG: uracil-DNA glycosylase family protein [Maricaulaceae bacterium]